MVQIREMETSDYDEAYLLWESVPGMGLNTLDNSQTGITKLLQKNPGLCFVAIVNKKIV